jgi:hypothetical protein
MTDREGLMSHEPEVLEQMVLKIGHFGPKVIGIQSQDLGEDEEGSFWQIRFDVSASLVQSREGFDIPARC